MLASSRCSTIKIVAASVPFRIVPRFLKPPMQPTLRHYLSSSNNRRTISTFALSQNNDHIIIEEHERLLLRFNAATKNPIPDFENARITFESKSTKELLRAAACFQTCKIPLLVENTERLLLTSQDESSTKS